MIGGVRHDLCRGQHAGLDETADCMAGDPEGCCRVSHCQPLAICLRGKISVDSMDSPERANPMRRPRLALAASPMDRQNYIAGRFADIGDDVDDEGAQELLA